MRIKPCGAYSRVLILAQIPVNSFVPFTHIKFSRIQGPARNVRKYVLRENVYSRFNTKSVPQRHTLNKKNVIRV